MNEGYCTERSVKLFRLPQKTAETIDALSSLNMPAGVDIRIKA